MLNTKTESRITFPAAVTLNSLPTIGKKSINVEWRVKSLTELYSKLSDETNIAIEFLTPGQLRESSKYRVSLSTIEFYEKTEENLALIRFLGNGVIILGIERIFAPVDVLKDFLERVCFDVKFESIKSD